MHRCGKVRRGVIRRFRQCRGRRAGKPRRAYYQPEENPPEAPHRIAVVAPLDRVGNFTGDQDNHSQASHRHRRAFERTLAIPCEQKEGRGAPFEDSGQPPVRERGPDAPKDEFGKNRNRDTIRPRRVGVVVQHPMVILVSEKRLGKHRSVTDQGRETSAWIHVVCGSGGLGKMAGGRATVLRSHRSQQVT